MKSIILLLLAATMSAAAPSGVDPHARSCGGGGLLVSDPGEGASFSLLAPVPSFL